MKKSAFIGQYVLIGLLACKFLSEVLYSVRFPYPYESFEISDWLINYEGGFVRRGLIGQVLLTVYSLIPFDVKSTIIAFDLVWCALFIGLMVHVCRRSQWSCMPFVFALALMSGGVPRYRRDFLVMIAVYAIYALYMRYQSSHRHGWLWLSVVLTCVFLLMYEPVFFLTVPVLALLYYGSLSDQKVVLRLLKTLGVFALPLCVMAFVCLWKGDAAQAQVIWQSWMNLFIRYPQEGGIPPVGAGVGFLGHDMMETFRFHADILFCINRWPEPTALLAALLLLCCYPLVYMIVTRVPQVDNKQRCLARNPQQTELSNIFIVQLVAMSPMLTVLSCDLERSIPYIVYTTFMLVYLANRYQTSLPVPQWLNRASAALQSSFDTMRPLRSFLGYTAVYILFLAVLFAWMIAAKGFLILS